MYNFFLPECKVLRGTWWEMTSERPVGSSLLRPLTDSKNLNDFQEGEYHVYLIMITLVKTGGCITGRRDRLQRNHTEGYVNS